MKGFKIFCSQCFETCELLVDFLCFPWLEKKTNAPIRLGDYDLFYILTSLWNDTKLLNFTKCADFIWNSLKWLVAAKQNQIK